MPAQTPQEQLEAIRGGYLVDGESLDLGAAVDAGAAHPGRTRPHPALRR
jgi:hypothetical protein